MKLNGKKEFYYNIKSQEEFERIRKWLIGKGINPISTSINWKNSNFCISESSVDTLWNLYEKDIYSTNTVPTFEEWCEKSIDGFDGNIPFLDEYPAKSETTLEPNQVLEWDKSKQLSIVTEKNATLTVKVQEILFANGNIWELYGKKTACINSYAISYNPTNKIGQGDETFGKSTNWMYAKDFIAKYGKKESIVEEPKKKVVYWTEKLGNSDVMTLNKGYEIEKEDSNCFIVINNIGKPDIWSKERFSDSPIVTDNKPIPKFKVGDKVQVCKVNGDNGKGWYSYNRYEQILGMAECTGTIEKVIWIDTEYYYKIREYHNGKVAEHALSLIEEKVPDNPLYKKEGNKYTFKDGYKGEHPFKVGQDVMVHTGSNDGSTFIRGILEKVDTKSSLFPLIRVRSGNILYACYPHETSGKDLVVTILSEPEEKTLVVGTSGTFKGNGIVEAFYNPSNYIPLDSRVEPDECYKIPIKKEKPKMNLGIRDTNIEKVQVVTGTKKKKTQTISLI